MFLDLVQQHGLALSDRQFYARETMMLLEEARKLSIGASKSAARSGALHSLERSRTDRQSASCDRAAILVRRTSRRGFESVEHPANDGTEPGAAAGLPESLSSVRVPPVLRSGYAGPAE
jgi:hypothetical protein